MTETLTVAEAMQELKRIDSLVDSRFSEITKYCSKRKGTEDLIPKQQEYVKEKVQSANDLLKRYTLLKLAIQKSNLTATITYQTRTMTIAEAILTKQYLSIKYNMFYDSFNTQTADTQMAAFQRLLMGAPKEVLLSMNMVPELYYDEKEVQQNKEDLKIFLSVLNVLIDRSNHETKIEI